MLTCPLGGLLSKNRRLEGMLYMTSTCSDDGSMELSITFEIGTDLDMANVLVQNRVAAAKPGLPEDVKRQGVTTKKKGRPAAAEAASNWCADGQAPRAFPRSSPGSSRDIGETPPPPTCPMSGYQGSESFRLAD